MSILSIWCLSFSCANQSILPASGTHKKGWIRRERSRESSKFMHETSRSPRVFSSKSDEAVTEKIHKKTEKVGIFGKRTRFFEEIKEHVSNEFTENVIEKKKQWVTVSLISRGVCTVSELQYSEIFEIFRDSYSTYDVYVWICAQSPTFRKSRRVKSPQVASISVVSGGHSTPFVSSSEFRIQCKHAPLQTVYLTVLWARLPAPIPHSHLQPKMGKSPYSIMQFLAFFLFFQGISAQFMGYPYDYSSMFSGKPLFHLNRF